MDGYQYETWGIGLGAGVFMKGKDRMVVELTHGIGPPSIYLVYQMAKVVVDQGNKSGRGLSWVDCSSSSGMCRIVNNMW